MICCDASEEGLTGRWCYGGRRIPQLQWQIHIFLMEAKNKKLFSHMKNKFYENIRKNEYTLKLKR